MSKLTVIFVVFVALFTSGCATNGSRPTTTAVGVGTGAVAGAMLNRSNSWKGAVLGAVIGGVAGSMIEQNQQQPQQQGQYYDQHSQQYYGQQNNGRTECEKVSEREWNNGRQTNNNVRERCTGRQSRYSY